VPPKQANETWRLDEPIVGLPFKMIRIPEGAVTYEVAGAKAKKKYGIVIKEDIWMASEESCRGLVDAFFSEFPSLRDEDWKTDLSKDLAASNLVVPTILRLCNWLSDKAGLERVYSFESQADGLRTVENFPEIAIDPYANGYRLPTFDELRFAGIHGDFDSFWDMIATKGMMERLASAPSSTSPTYTLYPNAWGFQGITGNMMEIVTDSDWKIGLMTGHSQIQLWNSFTSFRGELSSKIEVAGFRVVQGRIENRPKK
jgi:hypothetical protein